ncbi:MAG: hypothetical protein V3T53_06165 [Phycisphaerales bacterium]
MAVDLPKPTDAKAEHDRYLDERKSYTEAEREAGTSFVKWLITLSSGALGLSIVFISDIVPRPNADSMLLLLIGWLSLAFSVVAMIGCMLASQRCHKLYRDALDRAFAEGIDSSVWDRVLKRQESMPLIRVIPWLNLVGLLLFLMGIVSLALFMSMNARSLIQ